MHDFRTYLCKRIICAEGRYFIMENEIKIYVFNRLKELHETYCKNPLESHTFSNAASKHSELYDMVIKFGWEDEFSEWCLNN